PVSRPADARSAPSATDSRPPPEPPRCYAVLSAWALRNLLAAYERMRRLPAAANRSDQSIRRAVFCWTFSVLYLAERSETAISCSLPLQQVHRLVHVGDAEVLCQPR